MVKFYYNNLLSNQNITARPDLVWVADIIDVELRHSKKLYIFLCIDIHTNTIIAHTISKNTIKSSAIVKALSKKLESRVNEKINLLYTQTAGHNFLVKSITSLLKRTNIFLTQACLVKIPQLIMWLLKDS